MKEEILKVPQNKDIFCYKTGSIIYTTNHATV